MLSFVSGFFFSPRHRSLLSVSISPHCSKIRRIVIESHPLNLQCSQYSPTASVTAVEAGCVSSEASSCASASPLTSATPTSTATWPLTWGTIKPMATTIISRKARYFKIWITENRIEFLTRYFQIWWLCVPVHSEGVGARHHNALRWWLDPQAGMSVEHLHRLLHLQPRLHADLPHRPVLLRPCRGHPFPPWPGVCFRVCHSHRGCAEVVPCLQVKTTKIE